MTWSQFLRYLVEPNGIAAASGIALSILMEYVTPYNALAPKWKRVVFFGLCLLLPLVAACLGILTAGWSASWDGTLWPALVAGVLAFSAGQIVHTRWLSDVPHH